MRGWEKIFPTNGNQKKAGVAILISGKVDFKIKNVTRDKARQYIIIRGSIREGITILNIYAANTGGPRYIRQILTDIEGETDNNTTVVGDFDTTLISKERSSRQKLNKEKEV